MKLDSKERKALPDEIFGIAAERKYPLNDEAHVRKAIQFFKFAPPSRRNELANNINKRAKELKMKMKISKLSPFYKYADKQIVQEGAFTTHEYDDYLETALVEYDADEVTDIINNIGGIAASVLHRMFMDAFSNTSVEGLESLEVKVLQIIENDSLFADVYRQIQDGKHSINPIFVINNAMKKLYYIIIEFVEYNNSMDVEPTELVYEVFEDIFSFIKRSIDVRASKKEVAEKLKLVSDLVNNYSCNFYYVKRRLIELQWQCTILIADCKTAMDYGNPAEEFLPRMDAVVEIQGLITQVIKDLTASPNKSLVLFMGDTDKMVNRVIGGNMNMINVCNYLHTVKKEIKNEIDIILMGYTTDVKDEGHYAMNFLLSETKPENYAIISIISYLEGQLEERNVKFYNSDFTTRLDSCDLVALVETKLFGHLFVSKDKDGEQIYYGVCHDELFLLVKSCSNQCEYYLLKFYQHGKQYVSEMNLICRPEEFNKDHKLKAIRVCFDGGRLDIDNDMKALTEGLELDKDGNMKFTFSPQKSFMDEYSENHKLLIMNANANNYEAMKVNLAFNFALINYIEREIIHGKSKKLTDLQRQDAIKARMFAINDFKTYMKVVQKAEPGFDFTKYYQESDFGKLTIKVKKDEVVGLKKLFQAIMFS